jgi:hypothetical protein
VPSEIIPGGETGENDLPYCLVIKHTDFIRRKPSMSTETVPTSKRNLAPKAFGWSLIGLLALVIVLNSFSVVEYGHVGIRKTMGRLDDHVLSEGLQFKIPFVQTIIPVNVQVAKSETDAAASSGYSHAYRNQLSGRFQKRLSPAQYGRHGLFQPHHLSRRPGSA